MPEDAFYGLASSVMTREVATVSPDMSVREAAKVMATHRVSGLPVVDDKGRVVGMVTEGDLLRSRAEDQKRESWWLNLLAEGEKLAPEFVEYARAGNNMVQRVMHTDVITVSESTPLAEIANLMLEKGVKRFPVISNGKLVGIVSRADLVRALSFRQAKDSVI